MVKNLIWLVCMPAFLLAAPEGMQVESGQARLQQVGPTTYITTETPATSLQFSSFNVAKHEGVHLQQPAASSRALCRINNAAPSQIDGSLVSNGIVYIVNPAGVIFGPTATVNVAGLVAAASNLSNQDFLNQVDRFTQSAGKVLFQGKAVAKFVSLVGARVANSGIIKADDAVALASGDEVILGKQGSHVFVSGISSKGLQLSERLKGAGVYHSGLIKAKKVSLGAGDLYTLGIHEAAAGKIEAEHIDVIALSHAGLNATKEKVHLEGDHLNAQSISISASEVDLESLKINPNQALNIDADQIGIQRMLDVHSLNLRSSGDIHLGKVKAQAAITLDAAGSCTVAAPLQADYLQVQAKQFVFPGDINTSRGIDLSASVDLEGRDLNLTSAFVRLSQISNAQNLRVSAKNIYLNNSIQAQGTLYFSGDVIVDAPFSVSVAATDIVYTGDLQIGAVGVTIGDSTTSSISFLKNVYSFLDVFGDLSLITTRAGNITTLGNFGTNDAGDPGLLLGDVSVLQTAGVVLDIAAGTFSIEGGVDARSFTLNATSGSASFKRHIKTKLEEANGGDVVVAASGPIEVHGHINTSSPRLSTPLEEGNDGGSVSLISTGSDVTVHNINTSGSSGIGAGGSAGDITIKASFDRIFEPTMTFKPKGRIKLEGEYITARGGSAGEEGIPGEDGSVYLARTASDASYRQYFPDRATICGSSKGSNLTIQAKDIVAAQNEIWTQLGDLTLRASRNIFIGDHIALGNMTLSAERFYILRHDGGNIILSNGERGQAPSVQATAGKALTQTGLVTLAGIGTGDFVAQSLAFNGMQLLQMERLLLFRKYLLDFNVNLIQSMTPSIAPVLYNPRSLVSHLDFSPKLTNTEAAPLGILAKMIESDLSSVAPNEMHAWHALRDEVLQDKNPIEGAVNVYEKKASLGLFDPNRFVDGLAMNKRGKRALSYIEKVSSLLEGIRGVSASKSKWITYLINRFTKPLNVSEHNWDDIRKVATYRSEKAKAYKLKKGRVAF